MNATHSKSAAATTPGADAAASQAEETQGANTAEQGGDLDIAAALGLPAEGQETETDKSKVVDPDAEAMEPDDKSDDPAEDKDTTADDAADPGKSDDAEAKSDEATAEPGASEEEKDKGDEPAAEEEPPAEGKTPAWAQKRFDELTAARRTAEDEARQLREQNATLKAAATGAGQASPLDFIDTPEQLAELELDTKKLKDWAIRNRNGGKLGEVEYTAEQVAQIEATTTAQLDSDIPARMQYVQAKRQYDQVAAQAYPWLNDTKQGHGATVAAVLERYPQLRALPNYRLALANAMMGEKLRAAGIVIDDALIARLVKEKGPAKAAASTKPAASTPAAAPLRKPPLAPGRAGAMPPRSTPRAAAVRAAEDRVTRPDSSMDDLERSIAAKLS